LHDRLVQQNEFSEQQQHPACQTERAQVRVLEDAQPTLRALAAEQAIAKIAEAVEVQGAGEPDPRDQDQEGRSQRRWRAGA
jgi:hypothetical protein